MCCVIVAVSHLFVLVRECNNKKTGRYTHKHTSGEVTAFGKERKEDNKEKVSEKGKIKQRR